MSLYFDGFIACALRQDTPQQVIDTLTYMTRREEREFNDFPDDEFFRIEGWRDFLYDIQDYELAPGLIGSELKKLWHYYGNPPQPRDFYYTISFRRTMHDDVEFNYLWWHFLQWIAPYSEKSGFVGFYRETFSQNPVLIYFKDGKVYTHNVDRDPDLLIYNNVL